MWLTVCKEYQRATWSWSTVSKEKKGCGEIDRPETWSMRLNLALSL